MSRSSARLLAVAALALGVILLGCWYRWGGKYAAQTRALESADPVKDAEAAAAAGDYRLVGVMGVGLMVPGAQDYWRQHANTNTGQLDVRVIPNTSDVIESREHAHLQEIARAYAERYNVALLELLPATRSAPSTRPAQTERKAHSITSN